MLELNDISKDYYIDKKPYPALKHINLFFSSKQFCAILGPSGCGKTTLLNIIGGLDQYTSGDLKIDGISTQKYTSKEWDNYRNKRIGFIFQSYNLIPHLNVIENVELSLVLAGEKKEERERICKKVLKEVGLDDVLYKKPNQLSGGQCQRVAIARALVNNPEVILADEPTGALDSKTSVQVMDLLKEISKDRLVIVVTHNEEIANKYATRTIRIKDGEIQSDSNPEECVKNSKEKQKIETVQKKEEEIINKKKKSSMNFWTAIKLSFRNLFTKKTRTILTSVASSFGIIGVALVLALNNGFTNYISRVESQTASSTPINVPQYTVTYSSGNESDINQTTKFPDTDNVYPYITASATATYKYNNFSEKYYTYLNKLKNEEGLINDYIVNYVDAYSMNLVTDVPDSIDGENAGGVQKLDYISYNSLYSTLNSVTGLPTNYFHVLYGEEEYITESYDLIAGTYPKESNELVLVVDSYNRINFSILRALGFYNSNDVQEDALDSTSESHVKPITFESLLNKKYKIFKNDDFYKLEDSKEVLDGDGHLRNIHNYVQNDINELYTNSSYGTELKITGILRPSQSSVISLMTTGLCYLKSLQEEFTQENEGSQINEDLKDNVLMKNVEGVETGKVFETFGTDLISTISKEDVSTSDIRTVFDRYFEFRRITNYNNVYNSISNYLYVGQTFGSDLVPEVLLEHGINDLDYVSKYISNIYVKYLSNQYSSAINDVIGLYAYVSSYEIISNIVIFPANLTSKDKLIERLDDYNVINSEDTSDPDHASSLNEQVFYTDIVGSLTSGIGKMINIVSIVLIIFASISLLVSCVMTGIITYVSVIERTKEIGILRALGARKKDVGRLFEVESLFIGGIAGLIGCLVAYLITIPLNQILNIVYAEYNIGNIADLSIVAALVLIAISIVLTLISGVIPSRLAAKKDPVTALRDE